MANLESTAVVVLEAWTEGGTNGRRNVAKRVTLTLTGQGGKANKITASALGLQKILSCSNAVNADEDEVFVAAPSPDGSYIALAVDLTTDNSIGDITDTVTLEVKGIS